MIENTVAERFAIISAAVSEATTELNHDLKQLGVPTVGVLGIHAAITTKLAQLQRIAESYDQ